MTADEIAGDDELRVAASVANRALAAGGQSDMVWGHASVRDSTGRGVWMKAATWGFEEIGTAQVVLVSPDGDVLDGAGKRHIEYPIHTELMLARDDVNAVVHTHPPAACAFASLDVPLLSLTHDGVMFTDPPVPRYTVTGSLIRTRALGQSLAETIGDGPGCLIPQHGIVTVGPDAATAVMRAVLLARACDVQLRAMAAGTMQRWSSPEEVALKVAEVWPQSQIDAGYNYLARISAKP